MLADSVQTTQRAVRGHEAHVNRAIDDLILAISEAALVMYVFHSFHEVSERNMSLWPF
jgi:hypothetical protein